jgi:outer membrane protein
MKKILATALAASALVTAGSAFAQVPEGNWLIRGRAIYIAPNESNSQAGAIQADTIKVDSVWAPEIDISYFFTRNFALELVLTYPQTHDVKLSTAAGDVDLGSIKQIPPSLLAQYHFPLDNKWKPYVGAGVTWFYITDNNLSVPGLGNVIDVRKSNWGFAVQAGVDYALNKNWYLNADVKYIWVETKVNGTGPFNTPDSTLKIDPWVFGLGVGYRF